MLHLGGFHHSCLQKTLVSSDTCRDCICWEQELSDPVDFASEKILKEAGKLLSLGCLAGFKRKAWEDFSKANKIQFCFEISSYWKTLVLSKPQNKFSGSTIVLQFEINC